MEDYIPDYIPEATVRGTMTEVAEIPQDDVDYLTDQMMEEQPVILEYLYTLNDLPFVFEEDTEFNEVERNYILFVGIVIWKVLSDDPRPMRQVSWEDLFRVVDEMEYFAFKHAKKPQLNIAARAIEMIENHPEPELLRFITDAIRTDFDDPDYPPIRREYLTGVFFIFQVVLTALLNSREA